MDTDKPRENYTAQVMASSIIIDLEAIQWTNTQVVVGIQIPWILKAVCLREWHPENTNNIKGFHKGTRIYHISMKQWGYEQQNITEQWGFEQQNITEESKI